jgi:hypothetical protein
LSSPIMGEWGGDGGALGRLTHTLLLIFRYSKSMEEISTISFFLAQQLTEDLQLKRSPLD